MLDLISWILTYINYRYIMAFIELMNLILFQFEHRELLPLYVCHGLHY
jgi:hypothetical protein